MRCMSVDCRRRGAAPTPLHHPHEIELASSCHAPDGPTSGCANETAAMALNPFLRAVRVTATHDDSGSHVTVGFMCFVCSSVPLLVLACNRIGPADVAKCRPRLSSRALGPSVNMIYYCFPLRLNPLVGRSHLDVSVAWSLVCVKPSDPLT